MRQGWTWTLRSKWNNHRTRLLCLAVALMAVAASIWLSYEFWRLLCPSDPIWPSSPIGGIDLELRHNEVHRWFGRMPVYDELKGAVYPPASYAILWPLLGWLTVTPARWLWAATTVAALGWLVYLIVQESGAGTTLERTFVALMPLSMYATGATIGNGQLTVHILPVLTTGLLLLQRSRRRWREDLLAAALVLISLVKPNISAPFFWIVVFVPGTLRPSLLVCAGYVALTLFSASFQRTDIGLFLDMPRHSTAWAARDRYTDLPTWLTALGLKEWIIPASLLALAGLGLWTYRHRHGDLWLLLGVAALIARFLPYHRWYDDLLILLPMTALFRVAKRGPSARGSDVAAGALLAITMLAMLAPGGLYLFPPPWNAFYAAGQAIVWMIILVFLLDQARQEKRIEFG